MSLRSECYFSDLLRIHRSYPKSRQIWPQIARYARNVYIA